jgi:predicted Zn-dependent protease
LAAKGDLNAAIAEFRATLADQPANPKVHLNLGRALLLGGNTEAAIAEFEMAVKLQPGYPEAQKALQEAVEKQKAGQWDKPEQRKR